MTTIHVSTVERKRTRLLQNEVDLTTEELTAVLGDVEVGEKDGFAIIPARFEPCPEVCRRAGTKSDCGGGLLHRLDRNIVEVTALGLDIDKKPAAVVHAVLTALVDRGLEFWCWETYSHGTHADPDGAPLSCVRVLIPLKEPCPTKRPSAWRDVAWPALTKALGVYPVVDHACSNPGRVYYTPRKPTPEAVRETDYHPGTRLDWRPVLGDALDVYNALPDTVASALPEEDTYEPVDLGSLRERLKGLSNPEEWVPLIRNVLAGRAPTPPPEERTDDMPVRDEAWLDVTNALATVREEGENKDACLELLRDAYAASVADDPIGHQPWEKIRDQFVRACEKMPSVRAEKDADRRARLEAQKTALKKALNRSTAAPTQGGVVPTAAHDDRPTDAPVAPADPEGDDWTDGLIFVQQKHGLVLKNCTSNVSYVLANHPSWRKVFRLNRLTDTVEVHGGPFQAAGVVTEFRDALVAEVADWLQQQGEDLSLQPGDGVVLSRIRAIAERNAYNPLQDYLGGLVWDGVERLDGLLEGLFAATTTNAAGEDIREYLRIAGRRFAISAVARALAPGCKVDTVLILEGPHQGEHKSTAFRVLGGAFFTDQYVDIRDRNTWPVVTASWIVELSELETFRRSDETAQKAFFSQQEDRFRKAYGYNVQSYPRRCVFVGSSNNNEYLKDFRNRRYWPVAVGQIDLEGLEKARDQIWAEAVALYLAGGKEKCASCRTHTEARCDAHRWWFTRAEETLYLDAQTAERAPTDAFAEMLSAKFAEIEPAKRPREVTMLEALKLLELDVSRGHENRLGVALRRLGFSKTRRAVDGVRQVFWETPENILGAPHRPRTFVQKFSSPAGLNDSPAANA